jgi:hypothetical protein
VLSVVPGLRLLQVLACLFVLADMAGGIRWYSPVPFSDMWEGYIGFYDRVQRGDWSGWLAFHNEHRIFLARLLFWLDLSCFQGNLIFLYLVNYLLLGAISLVFYRYLVWCEPLSVRRKVLATVMLLPLFSWVQAGNLVWAFQSQFFMAQLLPLSAFYLLDRALASHDDSGGRLYIMACLAGLISPLAMANGVLALPLMLLQVCIAQGRRSWCYQLLLLTVLVWGLYFRGYTSPEEHGGVIHALLTHPFTLTLHVFSYLGGPLYRFAGEHAWSIWLARSVGMLAIVLLGVACLRRLAGQKKNPVKDWGLVIFGIYILGTAVATAGGRMKLGVDPVMVSRYTTPTLMLWVALLVLYRHALHALWRMPSFFCGGLLRAVACCLLVGMIHVQLKALRSHAAELYERRVSAIALALGIADSSQIEQVGQPARQIMRLAALAVRHDWSVFGTEILRDLSVRIGGAPVVTAERSPVLSCAVVWYSGASYMSGNSSYRQIYGRLDGSGSVQGDEWAYLLDERNIPVGVLSLMKEKKGGWHMKGYRLAFQDTAAMKLFYPQTGVTCPLHEENREG